MFCFYPRPPHKHLSLTSVFKLVLILAWICLFAGGKNESILGHKAQEGHQTSVWWTRSARYRFAYSIVSKLSLYPTINPATKIQICSELRVEIISLVKLCRTQLEWFSPVSDTSFLVKTTGFLAIGLEYLNVSSRMTCKAGNQAFRTMSVCPV